MPGKSEYEHKIPPLTQERRAWLAGLKDGDEVAKYTSTGDVWIETLIRLDKSDHPAVFRTAQGLSQYRADGVAMGPLQPSYLGPVTGEVRARCARQALRVRVQREVRAMAEAGSLSDAQIAGIAEVLGLSAADGEPAAPTGQAQVAAGPPRDEPAWEALERQVADIFNRFPWPLDAATRVIQLLRHQVQGGRHAG